MADAEYDIDEIQDVNHHWIKGIQRGDEEIFEYVFKEFYLKLSRFAWRYVKSKAVAEELVQEVFTDVWENKEHWQPAGTVQSYLYQMVKSRAIDFLRHQQVQEEYDPQWMNKKEQPTLDFDDEGREKQIRQAVTREVEALPPRSKMVYKLHRYDGLTYREIAEVMDISTKTVESHMRRALKRLRNRLSHLLPLLLFIVYLFMS